MGFWCLIYGRRPGALLRGANWNNGSNSGVFTANLNNDPSNTNTNIGFRCVFRPPRLGIFLIVLEIHGLTMGHDANQGTPIRHQGSFLGEFISPREVQTLDQFFDVVLRLLPSATVCLFNRQLALIFTFKKPPFFRGKKTRVFSCFFGLHSAFN